MLEISYELIAIITTILLACIGGIIYLIRSQMAINKELFMELANVKKDIEKNKENIIKLDELFEKNDKKHERIIDKLDRFYEIFVDYIKGKEAL